MSELDHSIIKTLNEFDFDAYGLGNLNETKDDWDRNQWIYDLASQISKDWCDYVDGV